VALSLTFPLDQPETGLIVRLVRLGLKFLFERRGASHSVDPSLAVLPLLLLLPLLAGCAHPPPAPTGPVAFRSPGLERCLQYWTAHHSSYPNNHFYVWPTDRYRGNLVQALVYWQEGGRLLDYLESPPGQEAQAWRLRPKVDRSSVTSDEAITRSNDLVPHGVWIRWVNQCITRGKEYVVPLPEARAAFPVPK
jgi:hypothetical protein